RHKISQSRQIPFDHRLSISHFRAHGGYSCMRTRSFWHQISLVSVLGLCAWGCTVKSSDPTGTAGATGTAGDMGSGGDTGTAGATGAGGGCPPATPAATAMGPGGSTGATPGPCDIYAAD